MTEPITSNRNRRRMIGMLRTRLDEVEIEGLADSRNPKRCKWRLSHFIRASLLGLMSGAKSLRAVEGLTEHAPIEVQRLLRCKGRLPDTTLRDGLCGMVFETIRGLLHRVVKLAKRRKALPVEGMPFHHVAMDGRSTRIPKDDETFAQKHEREGYAPYGLVRTVTSTLVSTKSKPCIDISPIPHGTNEMGHFAQAFTEMIETYGDLVKLVSYDAGANGEDNALLVHNADKFYLFNVNDERRVMVQMAADFLATKDVEFTKEYRLSNQRSVYRSVRLFSVNTPGILPESICKSAIWEHARTLVRIDAVTKDNDATLAHTVRYFVSNMPKNTLTPEQWVNTVVAHWGVETTHQIIDTAFAEDERPWINMDVNGVLVVMALRRIAYTLLALFRSVTQRSEDKRMMPWADLQAWVLLALLQSNPDTFATLRKREPIATL